jgi:hypothetical protein
LEPANETREWIGEGTRVEKFRNRASEPLAILKFDSAMSGSIGNSGAEVRTHILLATVVLPRRG